jgi:hypothetical protein
MPECIFKQRTLTDVDERCISAIHVCHLEGSSSCLVRSVVFQHARMLNRNIVLQTKSEVFRYWGKYA